MKKLFLLLVLSSIILASCGATPAIANQQQETFITATLIAKSPNVNVYKFNDGNRTCYITESSVNGGRMMSTGADIWCVVDERK